MCFVVSSLYFTRDFLLIPRTFFNYLISIPLFLMNTDSDYYFHYNFRKVYKKKIDDLKVEKKIISVVMELKYFLIFYH